MGDPSGKEIIDSFEVVLVNNLGEVGKFLLDQQLSEIGKTRDTFSEEDINTLIDGIKIEFAKVIGYGVDAATLYRTEDDELNSKVASLAIVASKAGSKINLLKLTDQGGIGQKIISNGH